MTGSDGVATAPEFTANATSGSYQVSASTPAVSTPVAFDLTNAASAPTSLVATAGNGQTATVQTAFATRLAVKALAASGSPVAGVTVTFTAPGSGASGAFQGASSTATAVTGSDGVATAPEFTANATSGSYQVSASTPAVSTPVAFDLTNAAAPPPGTPAAVVVADSYVRADVPASDFGTAAVLTGRTSPQIDSYIKFDVSGLNGAPLRAVLRLWLETTGTTAYKVYAVADNSWTELGLTFSNRRLSASLPPRRALRRRTPGWTST